MESIEVAVVGGGQAGLSMSRELTATGVPHVVLERGQIGQTWRDRWQSFCLVTPNWSVRLPGHEYDGGEPDGFMPRDEIVAYLERYATTVSAPVRTGAEVTSLDRRARGGFELRTTAGDISSRVVVLATGAYQRPHRPAAASSLPSDLLQIDVEDYVDESALPPGRVLIVGSGQSGCQIAEELHEAEREVVLACGKAPWAPRRLGGRDVFWWANESGFLDQALGSLPGPGARLSANILATGHHGGRDLNLRTLRALGVTLTGHLVGATGHEARFAADLGESVAWGDERYRMLMGLVQKTSAERGYAPPEIPEPAPFEPTSPECLDLNGFGAVIFAAGFRPDYTSWLKWPDAFDGAGFPIQQDGASTVIEGLYFLGVHFLRTRKSSLLLGVGEDAAVVAKQIAAR